jgi:hypothetical protein
MADETQALDAGLGPIEEAILPSLSAMLDTLLEATSLARPGVDAADYAARLKGLADEIDSLRCQVEAAAASPARDQAARAA